MLRATCAAVAVTAMTACLSAPPEPPNTLLDGATEDAPVNDAAIADAFSTDAFFPAGVTFPPVGRTMDLRAQYAADFNHDGISDVVLVSAADAAPADDGVYILLGSAGAVLDEYHAFVDTDELSPRAVFSHDFDSDGNVELVVLGRIDKTNAAVWLYPGQDQLTFGAPFKLPISNISQDGPGEPWWISHGYFNGTSTPDLVVGYQNHILRVPVQVNAEFANAVAEDLNPVAAEPRESFGQGAVRMPRPGNRDDLLLAHTSNITKWTNDGAGGFEASPLTRVTSTGFECGEALSPAKPQYNARFIDMDGDQTPDVVSSCGKHVFVNILGATALESHGFENTSVDYPWTHLVTIDNGNAAPDIVLVTQETCTGATTSQPSAAHIYLDLEGGSGTLSAGTTPTPKDLSNQCTGVIVKADFDDDGTMELVLFARDASTNHCFEVVGSGLLPCS